VGAAHGRHAIRITAVPLLCAQMRDLLSLTAALKELPDDDA